mgnify:CR=1 FL=1
MSSGIDYTNMEPEELRRRAKSTLEGVENTPKERPASALDNGDRITIQFAAHHQSKEHGAFTVNSGISHMLATKQQPYIRAMKVPDDKWVPIPLGWLDPNGDEEGQGISFLVVENRIGLRPQVMPTEEEKELWSRQRLFISLDGGQTSHLVVLSRFSQMFYPAPGCIPMMRSAEGEIPVGVTVIPA